MPQRVSHPDDVSMVPGLAQRVLWLGDPAAEYAGPGQCAVVGANPYAACRPRRGRRESAHVGRPALRWGVVWPPPGGALDAPAPGCRACRHGGSGGRNRQAHALARPAIIPTGTSAPWPPTPNG